MNASRSVVFDLIGVLAEPSWRAIAPDRAEAWGAFKTGNMTEDDFWGTALAQAYRSALHFRPDRLALLQKLKMQGVKVCLASNFYEGWLTELFSKTDQGGLFDASLISSRVGVAKPNSRFFELLVELVPIGSVFVDDKRENCEAARRAGLRSIWAYPRRDIETVIEFELAHLRK